jgi:hypothetical protein
MRRKAARRGAMQFLFKGAKRPMHCSAPDRPCTLTLRAERRLIHEVGGYCFPQTGVGAKDASRNSMRESETGLN